MSRKRWWVILWSLVAVAAGVHLTWITILMELDMKVPTAIMVVLVLFPGAMGWLMPLGFAWLWKDEIRD
jgi:apolipoprotein N-acyltransferase